MEVKMFRAIAIGILLVMTLAACDTAVQGEPTQEPEAPVEENQESEAPAQEAKEWTGEPWTIDDGPPWPVAASSATINAEGTNHRDVVVPEDFDFVRDRVEFWVEHPARHAPSGSSLAQRRVASRAQSELEGVDCQVSYVKRLHGGNSRLDRLMDRGVCWHYNVDVASEYYTAATMRRPDGQDGALAWFDEQGRLRWRDRYGQTQPRFLNGEPVYWEDSIPED